MSKQKNLQSYFLPSLGVTQEVSFGDLYTEVNADDCCSILGREGGVEGIITRNSHCWRQAAIEFDLNILVHEPAVSLEPGFFFKRQENPTHILSISKGKFDSSCRTKDEEIEVKENQRKSDLDSRGSDVSFIAGWRPSISQMKGTFVLKYLQGREKALIGRGRVKLQQSC